MSPDSAHLSALTLETLTLGTLTPAQAQAAREHLERCVACAARQAELRTSTEHFEREVFARTLPRVRERLSRPRRWPLAWRFVLPPLVALASLALFLVRPPPGDGPEPAFTAKGEPALQVFARRGGRVFQVKDGDTLTPGDEVRFAVQPGRYRYLLLASVDGLGKPSIYFPFGGQQSAALTPEARTELPDSIVLDAAPGPERLFALFSDAPLSAAEVEQALAALGRRGPTAIREQTHLPVEAGAQLSRVFDKVAP